VGEYCQTCHDKYDDEFAKHTRDAAGAAHDKSAVDCHDCHVPTLTRGGETYSIHDHRFNFSRPPPACGECHDPGEVAEEEPPPHTFNIRPVRFSRNMTVEEACQRCHEENEITWVREKIKSTRFD
jgi:hypothetical protein